MTAQTAAIDNKTVSIHRGETILEAARRAGVDIPTLCYHQDLSPEGGCRICLVETDPIGTNSRRLPYTAAGRNGNPHVFSASRFAAS